MPSIRESARNERAGDEVRRRARARRRRRGCNRRIGRSSRSTALVHHGLLARLVFACGAAGWMVVASWVGAAPARACAAREPPPIAAVTEVEPAAAAAPASIDELLRHAPGVRVVRHRLHEAALDTRGLEGATERRLLVRIDGRDASVPLVGTLPWPALAFVGEEVERLALERGPASARYGGGAYAGVLDLVTRSPREGRSEVRLGVGERESRRAWG